MVIEKYTVVSITYSMHDEQNNLLEDNDGYAPVIYLQGAGNILSELDEGLKGLQAGDAKEMVIRTKAVTDLVQAGGESSPYGEGAVAGESLRFNVKIISVRKATPAEINAGFPLPDNSCGCKPGCC